jgi:hypothetical protein
LYFQFTVKTVFSFLRADSNHWEQDIWARPFGRDRLGAADWARDNWAQSHLGAKDIWARAIWARRTFGREIIDHKITSIFYLLITLTII